MKLSLTLFSVIGSLWFQTASSFVVRNKNSFRVIGTNAVSLPTEESSSDNKVIGRKKWGVDKDYADEYWFDHRIHTLGNHGFMGALHAAVAPLSTMVIDLAAYQGVDVRRKLAKELSAMVDNQQARIVDLACGVGFSTRALESAFPEAESIWGIDTSPQMLAMANFITNHMDDVKPLFGKAMDNMSDAYKAMAQKGYRLRRRATHEVIRFARSNAENTALPASSFDLVTIMYAFHECPEKGRDRILQEAKRLLLPGGLLAVVDIASDYVPTESMLRGEPYVKEYQANIHKQLATLPGFDSSHYQTIVPHHLGMWTLKRSVV